MEVLPCPLMMLIVLRKWLFFQRIKLQVSLSNVDNYFLRDFVKFKKIQKSEKNSEVGGWVRPQLGRFLIFWGNIVFFVLFFVAVHVSKKNI